MSMAKQNGLNTVQTYVFWNIHEQQRGTYDFSGRANLSQFLQEAANAGLFVNLRIGPYVCAEWDYGGLCLAQQCSQHRVSFEQRCMEK